MIRDDPENPLTRADRLIVRLARKVSTDACICQSKCAVTVEDIATLGEAGISDAQVFDIVAAAAAAAAARGFFSKVPETPLACLRTLPWATSASPWCHYSR